jgi:hypothetical protein
VPGFVRLSEYQPECRSQGAKFGLNDESQIDLESIGKKKYAVGPGASNHIKVMHSLMPIVQMSRPISEHTRDIGGDGNPKGEIYIRPFIFARIGGGTSNCATSDPLVIPGEYQETGAQVIAFFGSKHLRHRCRMF